MKLEEIVDIDVSIYYDTESKNWKWDLNGGYSSCGGRNGYPTPNEALEELNRFLETFNGFEK